MAERVSFEPDLVSLARADQLSSEQGVTLAEVAAEAFSAYMQGVLAACVEKIRGEIFFDSAVLRAEIDHW